MSFGPCRLFRAELVKRWKGLRRVGSGMARFGELLSLVSSLLHGPFGSCAEELSQGDPKCLTTAVFGGIGSWESPLFNFLVEVLGGVL